MKRGALVMAWVAPAQRLLHTGLGTTTPRCGCTGAEMKVKTKQFSEATINFGEPLFSNGGARAALHEKGTVCSKARHGVRGVSPFWAFNFWRRKTWTALAF